MKDKIADYIKQTLLWLRWLTMSPKARYAYLWNRTRDNCYRD